MTFLFMFLAAADLNAVSPSSPPKPQSAVELFGVETILDRGRVFDVVVRCNEGTATVVFRKSDARFCTRNSACSRDLSKAARLACGS
ncbi:MAG: hypothetical protein AAFO75_03830 [Pseudomonadota bacterium]